MSLAGDLRRSNATFHQADSSDDRKSPAKGPSPVMEPKTLRQQCVERLADMPYGDVVLRELAEVSQNITGLLRQARDDDHSYWSDPQIGGHETPPPVPERPPERPSSAHGALHRDVSRATATACAAKDDNRLLAIIRESEHEQQQSAAAADDPQSSEASPQARDVTMVYDTREFDNMFEAMSKRFSNYELGGRKDHAATKRYSNIETRSFESHRRLEDGQVVHEETKRHSEKITDDNGNVSKSVESESGVKPSKVASVSENREIDQNSKAGCLNRDSGTTKIFGDDFLRAMRRDIVDDNFDFHTVPRRPNRIVPAWESRSNLSVVDESPENVTRPLVREDNLCRGQRSATEIKAPRLTDVEPRPDLTQRFDSLQSKVTQRRSMIDTTPITRHVDQNGQQRRLSLPKDFHEKQLQYIRQKESELQAEFEKLELDRKRLEEEITTMRMSTVRGESQSKRSSLLSDEEVFRQQMHSEWLDKVAEREERRLHKIIKITKPEDTPPAPKSAPVDIENEFLRKVKERRTKLHMPADSDWESGAESQPPTQEARVRNVEVKVVNGDKEASVKELPRHLQEFAESFATVASQEEEEATTPAIVIIGTPKTPPPKPRRFQALPRVSVCHQAKKHDVQVQLRSRKPTNQQLSASQLTLNRKSLSESDLLHEIDKSLVLAKGFLFAREELSGLPRRLPKHSSLQPQRRQTIEAVRNVRNMGQESQSTTPAIIAPKFKATAPSSGIWSPVNKSEPNVSGSQQNSSDGAAIPLPPPPPVWVPNSAEPSPQLGGRKVGFRPVPFESPTLTRRRFTRNPSEPLSPPVEPPWKQPGGESAPEMPAPGNSVQRLAQSFSAPSINRLGTTQLPRSQNPTMTLLQKAREERSSKVSQEARKPNEIIIPIRQENSTESGCDFGRNTMTEVASRQVDSVNQVKEGMPLVLRSEIREDNQSKWYKKVYNTIHKAKDDDDYVTVRYKTRRGRYPYRANGYMSEPEPNYDSDYSFKYSTLDRRRTPSAGSQYDDSRSYGTMPNPVRSGQTSYRNHPGRIENYTPGRSSVSERETREWWDEVMDIFDGWLDENSTHPLFSIVFAREVHKFHLEQQRMANSYSQGYLSRALKEQGYESDSSLVFRKRNDVALTPLSPVEQKQAYKSVQAGGEPPLQGFRKPAPEKPKDEAEPEIEYIPITPTLTKIRVHRKVPQPKATQVVCYPITSVTRPIDMFGAFPKEVKSFVPTVPPAPPSRKSSKLNSTLKLFSEAKVTSPRSHHEACFSSTTTAKGRSKSASSTYSASSIKEEKNLANSTRIQASKQICRSYSSSMSPRSHSSEVRRSSPSPVAFGRSISKERTFAEEKKRLEEALPQCRRLRNVTTRILRKSDVKSPDEVKKAIQNTFRILPVKDKPGTTIQSGRGGKIKPGTGGSTTKSTTHITTSRSVTPKTSSRTSLALSSSSKAVHKAPAGTRGRSVGRAALPVITTKALKSSLLKSTKSTGKSTSNLSLARTSSTYSIDSTNSKRRTPVRPTTITRFPISGKKQKKKDQKKTDDDLQLRRVESEIVRFEVDLKDEIEKKHRELRNSVNRSIRQHSDAIKTDSFFQNLFLRDFQPTTLPIRSCTVLDKVRLWNTLTTKSEPSLRPLNSYLIQKQPVTSSKFKMLEREHFRQSRSLSPVRIFRPGRLAYEHISKFDSFYQLSDEEEEFGSLTEFNYSYQERSRSEPPGSTVLTEIVRPNSPVVIHGRRSVTDYRESSEKRSSTRSPSCRRIQSFRSTTQTSTERSPKVVTRAKSLNSADREQARRNFLNEQLSHSSTSLNTLEKHTPACNHGRSERFQELNKFYSNLERVGQLERATSSSDLRPIRRQEEIIDFDLWKKIRAHERAEKELNFLVGKLKQEQKERDLLFRPKDVEDLRWNQHLEPGLRIKEKSVEDLREMFQQKASQTFPDEDQRQEIESNKDTYKPFWRGNSVVDLATNMIIKYNPGEARKLPRKIELREDKCFGLSRKLVSTLSKDQVAKLKHQLNEIYSSGPGEGGKKENKYEEISEKYVVTVPASPLSVEKKSTPLTVRSHSLVSREELLTPVLKRHQARIALDKAESISSINEDKVSKVIHKFENVLTRSADRDHLTEVEKKRLSASLCHEIKDIVAQRRQRMASPSVVAGKETRGAIAAESAKESLPGRPYYSLELTETVQSTSEGDAVKSVSKIQTKSLRAGDKKTVQHIVVKESSQRPASKCETESGSSEASNRTVIYMSGDAIKNKIQYFEEKEKNDNSLGSTIYHAREDSSPDEEEVMKIVEQKVKQRQEEAEKKLQQEMKASQSFTDLREIFGEKTSVVSNYTSKKSRSVSPVKSPTKARGFSPEKSLSNTVSIESVSLRSRSISPEYSDGLQRCYLNMVCTGDVQKMRHKFESLSISPSPVAGAPKKPRRFRSDPDLSKSFLGERGASPVKTTVRDHEMGDVSWITHKFETRNAAAVAERSRSRTRRTSSPIQKVAFRRDDRRFMPHIDIISKTASLRREIKRTSPVNGISVPDAPIKLGEVEKIRHKFEENRDMSLLGQMYTSAPDITELKDISSYLTGPWVAHRYPRPQDNARSLYAKSKLTSDGVSLKRRDSRPSSTSPPRTKSLAAKILRPFYDVFADQKFDPLIHRPKSRYVPDMKREAEALWQKIHGNVRKPSVKFQENAVVPPPPPIKGVPLNGNLQSPVSFWQLQHNVAMMYYVSQLINWQSLSRYPIFISITEALTQQRLSAHNFSRWLLLCMFNWMGDRLAGQESLGYIITHANPVISDYNHNDVAAERSPTPPRDNGFGGHKGLASSTQSDLRLSDASTRPIIYGPIPYKSPHRYVESDVNIHYRSPIRYEYKDPIAEDELARRQAEAMKRIYQEERRRKYLQELQDMSNRRHTDMHPNQKSPIPLNRFDDFGADDYSKQLLPRTVARALFNFQGQSARELSFKKGDIIYIRRQIDKNWYEGEHNAMLGLLPLNYVEIISKDGVRCPPKPKPAEGQARAKYNFNAQSAIELSLNKGELIKLTRRVDDNWFEGRIANRKGIFPVAYVEVLTDIGSDDAHVPLAKPVGSPAAHSLITPELEVSPYTRETRFELEAPVVGDNGVIRGTRTVKKTEVLHVDTNSDPIPYRALYKYKPQNPDEMDMDEGDIVYVLEKCDDGWFVGTSQRTGCFGTFPGNYVEKI
ncbi:uncharacterized protein LOC132259068 [Phlebotomus argentipes]|uniref:uncharacterized protein LOC132259068 n=1 Tax=Phlebotomus argentipes TaxID=94469 RepID=UPI0028932489|nr:uncharacterized protein LOC132259068 [Phlebotomus argentipes]